RVGFTFAPERHALPGLTWYTPAFKPDQGTQWQLTSSAGKLALAGNRLYDLMTGMAYNPGNPVLPGPAYTLTAPDGTAYRLDCQGVVTEQISPGGAHLYYSDSGIVSANGAALSFVRDSAGRLASVTAPDGALVYYQYDNDDDLVAVRTVAGSR